MVNLDTNNGGKRAKEENKKQRKPQEDLNYKTKRKKRPGPNSHRQ